MGLTVLHNRLPPTNSVPSKTFASLLSEVEVEEEETENTRRWEDLNKDLLVTIFAKLDIPDLITGAPFVCSAWFEASKDPLCWRNLDFSDWDPIAYRLACHLESPIDFADILDFSINRSDEFLDSVHFPFFADEIDLLYVADRCPELLYFTLENSEIPEEKFCEAIGKFQFLKGMAVDESLICREVLQHVDECCIYFSELKVFAEMMDIDTASVICECLPYLRKLEIMNCSMSRPVILTFLDGLKDLEYLDISADGDAGAGITDVVLEKASRLKVFLWESRFEDGKSCGCSDYSPCDCELDRQVMEWLPTLP